MKKILGAALAAAMVFAMAPAAIAEENAPTHPIAPEGIVVATVPTEASDEIKITYNGTEIETDVKPVIVDDRTLVPARAVFETMGCTVDWIERTWRGTQMVTVSKTMENIRTQVSFDIGSGEMEKQITQIHKDAAEILSEETVSLDVPARIIGDRTMIPARAVAEALGADVQWDGETRTVVITEKEADMQLGHGPVVENPSFALKLKEHMPTDKNYMVSPFSIKVALAMTANGGQGEAREEILKTLGIDDLDEFNEYVKKFIADNNSAKEANSEREKEEAADTEGYGSKGQRGAEFELADSVWLNKDYYGGSAPKIAFAPEFEKIAADYYDGKAGIVTDSDAVDTINDWISDKTRGKITNVLSEPNFLAALVNTIYMKAQWREQFSESATEKGTFTDRDGKETEIDFMNQTDRFDYYADADTRMVRLSYNGGFSMYVVLGDSSNFEMERGLTENKKVALSMPKWKTESEFKLAEILKEMGINAAFSGGFNPMFINAPETEEVYIDDVIHKTYIDVDEEGTEAAAVTVVLAGAASMPPPEEIVEFKADKPFTYFICDDDNGEILFMGEYAYAE